MSVSHWVRAVTVTLSLALCAACTSHSEIEDVVKGFFGEINRSNFETAKTTYLSTALINLLNSPLTVGQGQNAIQKSFGGWVGKIQSVEIVDEQVKGEQATVTAKLLMPWGSKWAGKLELIKQNGKDWKISDWEDFKGVGWEHVERARGFCNAQGINSAVPEFQAALGENPADAFILAAFGECYAKAGNLALAEEKLSQSTKMYPDTVWQPYLGLADVYSKEGKLIEAEKALQRAVRNKPDEPAPYNGLAWFYAEHGMKLDQAIELAQKALSLSPDDAAILDTLGWAYYRKGDRTQAVQYLAQAARKEPSNQEIQAHYRDASVSPAEHVSEHLKRAQGLFAQQQYDQALAECDRALQYDSGNQEALSLKNRILETKKVLGYR